VEPDFRAKLILERVRVNCGRQFTNSKLSGKVAACEAFSLARSGSVDNIEADGALMTYSRAKKWRAVCEIARQRSSMTTGDCVLNRHKPHTGFETYGFAIGKWWNAYFQDSSAPARPGHYMPG